MTKVTRQGHAFINQVELQHLFVLLFDNRKKNTAKLYISSFFYGWMSICCFVYFLNGENLYKRTEVKWAINTSREDSTQLESWNGRKKSGNGALI